MWQGSGVSWYHAWISRVLSKRTSPCQCDHVQNVSPSTKVQGGLSEPLWIWSLCVNGCLNGNYCIVSPVKMSFGSDSMIDRLIAHSTCTLIVV